MIATILAILILGSLALMGVVIRDIGRELSDINEDSKGREEE